MSTAIFLRFLRDEDKAGALAETISALREGRKLESVVYPVSPVSFRQVPGSPFAYWVNERIRRLFTELPAFESDGRTVRQGLATADDFRFVRACWEVPPECILDGANGPDWSEDIPAFQDWCRHRTFEGKRWVPFAKGGTYSPYYADLHLVVNWERNGEEMKAWADPLYGNSGWSRIIKSVDLYFSPGLTWPLRAARFAPSALPSGSIFSVRGYAILASLNELRVLGGLGNSASFDFIFKVLLGRFEFPEFIVGILQQLPVPELSNASQDQLAGLMTSCVNIKSTYESTNETCHIFHLPTMLQVSGDSFAKTQAAWQTRVIEVERELVEFQHQVDDIVFRLYGIDGHDRRVIEEDLNELRSKSNDNGQDTDLTDEEAVAEPTPDASLLVADLLSYVVGCIFGRWDVRFAIGGQQQPTLPDAFAPLPVCSPGMLAGDDGLPLHEPPLDYPLRVNWDGILPDAPDHPDDIVHRVQEMLELLWQDHTEAIEREACEILGVKELRDYFRKPGKGGFSDDHISRYSKSRRKAPIYWLLQSSKKNYALWIYYHRLDKAMLFKALMNYVEPKIRLEESRLESLRAQRTATDTSGKGVKRFEKEIERQEDFISELRDFEEKLRRVANLHLTPDLNDGVVLNIAPLWELVPWKEAKKYWDELLAGKYEWSSIGAQLRQRGIVHRP